MQARVPRLRVSLQGKHVKDESLHTGDERYYIHRNQWLQEGEGRLGHHQ